MKVDVVFFPDMRKTPPCGDAYRPHFVIKGTSDFLGIQFETLDSLPFGTHIVCSVKLLYDDVYYSRLTKDVPFFIMEGATAVGDGIVIE